MYSAGSLCRAADLPARTHLRGATSGGGVEVAQREQLADSTRSHVLAVCAGSVRADVIVKWGGLRSIALQGSSNVVMH